MKGMLRIGDLVVVTSSGSEEVDKYFRDHLAQVFHAGERLAPGVYAFRVGP